jgi:hypothetical protein
MICGILGLLANSLKMDAFLTFHQYPYQYPNPNPMPQALRASPLRGGALGLRVKYLFTGGGWWPGEVIISFFEHNNFFFN